MTDELSKGMIYQKLKEIRDTLENDAPVKEVAIVAEHDLLTHDYFRLYYHNGHWVTHFALNAPSLAVAAIMKAVLRIVDVEVDGLFYYSKADMKVYIGHEAIEKFIDDISVSLLEDNSILEN